MRVTIQPHYTAEILHDCFFAEYTGEPIASNSAVRGLIYTDIPKILMNLPSSVWFGKITIRRGSDEGGEIYVEWQRPMRAESTTEINSAKLWISGESGRQIEEDITQQLVDEVTRQVTL
ncbi:hypothetical protein [uncultured Porphyromonas sp.]|uniref:hypothetical protein n=1 Tax=uncultured Porphyromonas sp. TaxID=159274 RepID=UPI0026061CE8|nr:hypothetical protein [uncultured Porphyromonas sp.]